MIEEEGLPDDGIIEVLKDLLVVALAVPVYSIVGKPELTDIHLIGGEGPAGELVDFGKLLFRGGGGRDPET